VVYLIALLFAIAACIYVAGLRFGFRIVFDYGPLSSDIPRIEWTDQFSWEQVWLHAQSGLLWILGAFVMFLAVTIASAKRGKSSSEH
jgi:hypothetical protein